MLYSFFRNCLLLFYISPSICAVSSSYIANNLASDDSDLISLRNKSFSIKDIYQGIVFVTPHKLRIIYYGNRYSPEVLLQLLSGLDSANAELAKLSSLNFDTIIEHDLSSYEIRDAVKVSEVSFVVTSQDDNLIKRRVYDSKSNRLLSYYSAYMTCTGLNLAKQKTHPIKLADLNIAVNRLKAHFEKLGHTYSDVGYSFSINSVSGDLKVRFFIDLGPYTSFDVVFSGGYRAINSSLRSKVQRHVPAFFGAFRNQILGPDFILMHLSTDYSQSGYFDARVTNYAFDSYKKQFLISVEPGTCYSVSDVYFNLAGAPDLISEKERAYLNKILTKGKGFYSKKKSNLVLARLKELYSELDNISIKEDLRFSKQNKTVQVVFVFSIRPQSPKKILSLIKINGNFNVGSDIIASFLQKKVGDMISVDDLQALKEDLYRTECFQSVDLSLYNGPHDSYELFVEVKEGVLWGQPQIGMTDVGDITLNLSKNNFMNSGRNASLSFHYGKTEENSNNKDFKLDLFLTSFLPNGKEYSYGLEASFQGKLEKLKEKMKAQIFNQDQGLKLSFFLITELLNRRTRFELGARKFGLDNFVTPYLQVGFNLFDKHIRGSDFFSHVYLSNTCGVYYKKKESPYFFVNDCLNFNAKNVIYLSSGFSFKVFFNVGHCFYFNTDERRKKYHLFQSLLDSEIGSWGPKKKGVTLGGDSRIGASVGLHYRLFFDFMPTFFQGTDAFVKLQGGSIFNLADSSDIQKYFRSGISFGLEIPFMQQMRLVLAYVYPFNKQEDDHFIRKGFNLSVTLDFGTILGY